MLKNHIHNIFTCLSVMKTGLSNSSALLSGTSSDTTHIHIKCLCACHCPTACQSTLLFEGLHSFCSSYGTTDSTCCRPSRDTGEWKKLGGWKLSCYQADFLGQRIRWRLSLMAPQARTFSDQTFSLADWTDESLQPDEDWAQRDFSLGSKTDTKLLCVKNSQRPVAWAFFLFCFLCSLATPPPQLCPFSRQL